MNAKKESKPKPAHPNSSPVEAAPVLENDTVSPLMTTSESIKPASVLNLQRTIGNTQTSALLQRSKVTVNHHTAGQKPVQRQMSEALKLVMEQLDPIKVNDLITRYGIKEFERILGKIGYSKLYNALMTEKTTLQSVGTYVGLLADEKLTKLEDLIDDALTKEQRMETVKAQAASHLPQTPEGLHAAATGKNIEELDLVASQSTLKPEQTKEVMEIENLVLMAALRDNPGEIFEQNLAEMQEKVKQKEELSKNAKENEELIKQLEAIIANRLKKHDILSANTDRIKYQHILLTKIRDQNPEIHKVDEGSLNQIKTYLETQIADGKGFDVSHLQNLLKAVTKELKWRKLQEFILHKGGGSVFILKDQRQEDVNNYITGIHQLLHPSKIKTSIAMVLTSFNDEAQRKQQIQTGYEGLQVVSDEMRELVELSELYDDPFYADVIRSAINLFNVAQARKAEITPLSKLETEELEKTRARTPYNFKSSDEKQKINDEERRKKEQLKWMQARVGEQFSPMSTSMEDVD